MNAIMSSSTLALVQEKNFEIRGKRIRKKIATFLSNTTKEELRSTTDIKREYLRCQINATIKVNTAAKHTFFGQNYKKKMFKPKTRSDSGSANVDKS